MSVSITKDWREDTIYKVIVLLTGGLKCYSIDK